MERSKVTVLISAAERSGDGHAANLVREIRRRRPEVEFEGFGGDELRAAGCRLHEDLIGIASMVFGFLGHIGAYLRAIRTYDRLLREVRPRAVLFVDSPGFHFILARLARWRGIPVAYYICPQIWALAPWRRAKILRYTDLLLTILPFEEAIYRDPRVAVKFVGHPLGDALASFPADCGARLREAAGIPAGVRVIGILPGSRTREVNDLMPIFRRLLDGMDLPKDSHHVLVSCCRKEFEPVIAGALDGCRLPWRMVADDSRAVAAASDFVLVKSGTASLETAYFARPMLVLYRASALERFLYRLLAVTPFFALPNILGASLTGGEPLVPERLCRGDEGADLAPLVLPLLAEDGARSLTVERLRRLRETYLAPGATARAAAAFLDFLAEQA